MNRDELLTKLAMELGEWPRSARECVQESVMQHGVCWTGALGIFNLSGGIGFQDISKQEWLQRRAELINKPSWDDAPEWAQWLAQDAPGAWFWFQDEPSVSDDEKRDDPRSGRVRHASRGVPLPGHDWRQTLEKRPEFNEYRADTIGQNGNDGQHYCTDGRPCGNPDAGDDPYCMGCPHEPDEQQHSCTRCGGSYYSPPHDECPCQSGRSDGSTANYYELPPGATELQDLISYRNLNAQDGEIFRAVYRKGRASHSDALRDAKKVLFYAEAEVRRLEAYGE